MQAMRAWPSAKPASMQRSSSSSAAALLGAQIRMRGLAATTGSLQEPNNDTVLSGQTIHNTSAFLGL